MNIYLVLLLCLIFYFVIPFCIIVFITNKKIEKILIIVYVSVFLIALIVGLYFKVSFENYQVVIVPNFSGEWFNKTIDWTFNNLTFFDFAINIAMLIPIGILCRYFTDNKSTAKRIIVLLAVAVVSGIITEFGQYVLPIPRSVQLSDCLFNMISVVIGGMFGSIFFWAEKRRENSW